jgi:hypothetical protein
MYVSPENSVHAKWLPDSGAQFTPPREVSCQNAVKQMSKEVKPSTDELTAYSDLQVCATLTFPLRALHFFVVGFSLSL